MFLCIVMDKSVKKLNNPWYLDGLVLPDGFSPIGEFPWAHIFNDSLSGFTFSPPS